MNLSVKSLIYTILLSYIVMPFVSHPTFDIKIYLGKNIRMIQHENRHNIIHFRKHLICYVIKAGKR